MKVRLVAVVALFSLGMAATAAAQQPSIEATSQPAVATLRAIARTIKECPEAVQRERKWGKGPLEIERYYFGPPKNVVWDVAPSGSVRAPYAGFIEFSVHYRHWVPSETRDKYARKYPNASFMDTILSHDWKVRYEYDVGPEGVELTRALDTAGSSGLCWDNAARKGQTVSDKGKQ